MAVPDQLGTYPFRSAEAADASKVAELVDAAYGHYVERIGMLPGPMTDDYAEVIRNRQVTVAEHHYDPCPKRRSSARLGAPNGCPVIGGGPWAA